MGACHACKSYFNKAVRYIDTILQRQKKKKGKEQNSEGREGRNEKIIPRDSTTEKQELQSDNGKNTR